MRDINKYMRDIEALERELNINIVNTDVALAMGSTRYFLDKKSKAKLNLNYNCYEQNLYDYDILRKEIKLMEKQKKEKK